MADTKTELTKWQKGVQRQLRIALQTIGLVLLLMIVGFVLTGLAARSQASHRAQDAKNQATQRAQDAVVFAKKIQDERKKSLVVSCTDTNSNNTAATSEANKLPASTRPYVFNIINKLAPMRTDCVAYANSRVKAK